MEGFVIKFIFKESSNRAVNIELVLFGLEMTDKFSLQMFNGIRHGQYLGKDFLFRLGRFRVRLDFLRSLFFNRFDILVESTEF